MDLPANGQPRSEILDRMREMKSEDADWKGGRTWSLIYPAGDDVDEILREAANLYLFENALNPFRFPSLRRMETEVVEMTAGLLRAPAGFGGCMTSGGTESILMAVKTARDRAAAERGVTAPELLAPFSAHPAFAKAAHYLGLTLKQIPLNDQLRADVKAAAGMITDQTALVVGSAPSYPHGVIDPIEELAALASRDGISFHTDACVGGFLLPFMQMIGAEVTPFDFTVEGVTTMSSDVHKYGYATKGASVILHRDGAHLQYQTFLYSDWPGGMYGSFAMAGARPSAPIAVAWAVMNYLGIDGYKRLTKRIVDTVDKLREGIQSIDGLTIIGESQASIIAFGSDDFDIMAVGDGMDRRGWHLDRQANPSALHMMVSPEHDRIVDEFLSDLRESVEQRGASAGVEARYS